MSETLQKDASEGRGDDVRENNHRIFELEKELRDIIARQQALGKRLVWLLAPPIVIAIVMVPLFLIMNTRIEDVEVGEKLVNIERYLLSDKNYPQAIQQYENLAIGNRSPLILSRLAMLYFLDDQSNATKAIEQLEKAKQIDPNSSEVYRNLTYIYYSMHRIKDAIEAGEKTLKLNDKDAAIYNNNLAWMYANDEQNLDLALKYAQKAVSLTKGQQVDMLDTLADVYHHVGDDETAIATFRKAKEVALGDQKKVEADFKRIYPDKTL